MIQLLDICKSFEKVVAVDRMNFQVEPGRIMGFLGPNGAGKTTTIRMIMNILQPDSGSILFAGQPELPKPDQLGYLPEERGLYQKITVLETITYFARLKGRHLQEREILEMLDRFELADRAQSKVQELSKGNQQKLQFINTIIQRPTYLILDEPFTGLDPVNQVVLKEMLRELKQEGRTIIFSSHQMDQVERICDDVALVDKGRLVLSGDLREIRRQRGQKTLEVVPLDPADLDHPRLRELDAELQDDRVLIPLDNPDQTAKLFHELTGLLKLKTIRVAEPGLEEIFIAAVQGGGE